MKRKADYWSGINVVIELALVAMSLAGRVDWYFVTVMAARSIIVAIIRRKLGLKEPKIECLPDKIKSILQGGLILTALVPDSSAVLIFVLSSLATFMSVTSGFQIVILSVARVNPSWLLPLKHKIGVANWLSISRLAMATIVPRLYVSQPLGVISSYVATILLIVAIATDKIDGIVARRRGEITRIGRTFDPLGDKFIQYLSSVGLVIAGFNAGLFASMPSGCLAMIALIIARDVCFVTWWALTHGDMAAGIVDKARTVVITLCMTTIALALWVNVNSPLISRIVFGMVVASAVLSVMSVIVDINRWNKSKTSK
ncbi:MAG: CDP-alcohol phosphatidyltransferase family protein [Candidatus Nomurabacteria bacterium]|nr:CDP-alcohol phosphatidyltransferase family protein [Candidatus Nomurabacteria bacterium]